MRKRHIALIALATVACALASTAPILAQEASPTRPTIRVSSDASITVKPDEAEINLGVVTQAETAQAAAIQNAQKQDAVIAELRKILGANADIKTIGYSVSPTYRYPKEGGQPTISGYSASNTVQIKTSDLSKVGKLIDASTQAGANSIQALRYTLKDDSAARAQALREASTKARAKAEAIASALGLKIARVLRVEEGASGPRPLYEIEGASGGALRAQMAPTPVEAGSIEVRASITLTVEILQ
ncbi:MAG TPA: SIMPL domain-containing protein [Blastocatellia bacterium]|nr:SIMPL domain-containing protein [Blastocatellia bacterium]